MRKLTVENNSPLRLKPWLGAKFPALSKRAVQELLRGKDIRVNGRRTGEDVELKPGDEVVLYIDNARLDSPPLEIVWLTDALLVAVKPPGITAKAEGQADMEELAAKWLAENGHAPFVTACHRLDNQTGGLMMLARSARAAEAVRSLMEAGKIIKTYHCIVKGVPKRPRNTLKAWIMKDEAAARVTVLDSPAPGARTAVTEYRLVKSDGVRSLLEVTLHTGRTHQIRAHMAHIGHPLLGDDKYGDRDFNRAYRARRQKLWASRLEFRFASDECPLLAESAGKVLESAAPFMDEVGEEHPR